MAFKEFDYISPVKILAVDDDLSLLKLYEVVIGNWPMAPVVTVAENGATALLYLDRDHPDMLLLDLHLADVDGLKMVHELRANVEFQSMLIIVVSGMSALDIEKQGGLPPDVLYMRKPVQFGELQALALELEIAKKARSHLASIAPVFVDAG
ncbi:PleD family two-component system response regulator [Rhodoferax sp. PAMC 29310]|uniref:response regulator n=1 Tax=Rhodoferax sp. PAMC 29310 TaxID=2822760 RepID=UPI001B325571|nr:response regulator [Rhodoferax sp. PAMC 29310]